MIPFTLASLNAAHAVVPSPFAAPAAAAPLAAPAPPPAPAAATAPAPAPAPARDPTARLAEALAKSERAATKKR